MGYAISYTSLEPVSESDFAEIELITKGLGAAYTWLSCEPIWLSRDTDGYLSGFSKPNFDPHPEDRCSAEAQGLPDGTLRELLDGLCLISRRFGVDWQVGDDHTEEIGCIRGGDFDDAVWQHFDAMAEACLHTQTMLGDFDDFEGADDEGTETEPGDDDDPPSFRFPE